MSHNYLSPTERNQRPYTSMMMKSSIKQDMFPQHQPLPKPTRDHSAHNRSRSLLSKGERPLKGNFKQEKEDQENIHQPNNSHLRQSNITHQYYGGVPRSQNNDHQEWYQRERQSNIVYNNQMKSLGNIFGDQKMQFEEIKANIEDLILNDRSQRISSYSKTSQKLLQKVKQLEEQLHRKTHQIEQLESMQSIGLGNSFRQSNISQDRQCNCQVHNLNPDFNTNSNYNLNGNFIKSFNGKSSNNLNSNKNLSQRSLLRQEQHRQLGQSIGEFNADRSHRMSSKNQLSYRDKPYQSIQEADIYRQQELEHNPNINNNNQKKITSLGGNGEVLKSYHQPTEYDNHGSDHYRESFQSKQSEINWRNQRSINNNERIHNSGQYLDPNQDQRNSFTNPRTSHLSENNKNNRVDQTSNHTYQRSSHHMNENIGSFRNEPSMTHPNQISNASGMHNLSNRGSSYLNVNQEKINKRDLSERNSNLNERSQHTNQLTSQFNDRASNMYASNATKSNRNLNTDRLETNNQQRLGGDRQMHPHQQLVSSHSLQRSNIHMHSNSHSSIDMLKVRTSAIENPHLQEQLIRKNQIIQQMTRELDEERRRRQQIQDEFMSHQKQQVQASKHSFAGSTRQITFSYEGCQMTPNGLLLELKKRDDQISHKKYYITQLEQETGRLKDQIYKVKLQSQQLIKKSMESIPRSSHYLDQALGTSHNWIDAAVGGSFQSHQSGRNPIENYKQLYESAKEQLEIYQHRLLGQTKKVQIMNEKIQKAERNIAIQEQNLRRRSEEHSEVYQTKLVNLEERLQEEQTHHERTHQQLHDYKHKIEQLLQQGDHNKSHYDSQLQALEQRLNDYQAQNHNYVRQEEQLIRKLQQKEDEISNLSRNIQGLTHQLQNQKLRHSNLHEEKSSLMNQAQQAGNNVRQWIDKYNKLEHDHNFLKNEHQGVRGKLDQLAHQHSEYKTSYSPQFKQQLNTQVYSLNETIRSRQAQLDHHKTTLQKEKQMRLQLDRQLRQELNQQRQQRLKLQQQYQQIKNQYHKVSSEVQQIHSQKSFMSTEQNQTRNITEELERKLVQANHEISSFKEQLHGYQTQLEQMSKIKGRYQSDIDRLKNDLLSTKTDLDRKDREYKMVQNQYEAYKQSLQEEREKVRSSFSRRLEESSSNYKELLQKADQQRVAAVMEIKADTQHYQNQLKEAEYRNKQFQDELKKLKEHTIIEYEQKLRHFQGEKQRSDQQIRYFENKMQQLEKQMHNLNSQFDRSNSQSNLKVSSYEASIAILQNKLSELQQELKQTKEGTVPHLKRQIQQKNQTYYQVIDEMGQHRKKVDELNSAVKEKEIDLKHFEKQLNQKNSDLEYINKLRTELQNNFSELNLRYQQKRNEAEQTMYKNAQFEAENRYLKEERQRFNHQKEYAQQEINRHKSNLYELQEQNRRNNSDFQSYKLKLADIFRNHEGQLKDPSQANQENLMKTRQSLVRQLGQFLQVDIMSMLSSGGFLNVGAPFPSKNDSSNMNLDYSKYSNSNRNINDIIPSQNHLRNQNNSITSFPRDYNSENKIEGQNNSHSFGQKRSDYKDGKESQFQRPISNRQLNHPQASAYSSGNKNTNPNEKRMDSVQQLTYENPNTSSYGMNTNKRNSQSILNLSRQNLRQRQSIKQLQRNSSRQHYSHNKSSSRQANILTSPTPANSMQSLQRVSSDRRFTFKREDVPLTNSITQQIHNRNTQYQRNSNIHDIHAPNFDHSRSNSKRNSAERGRAIQIQSPRDYGLSSYQKQSSINGAIPRHTAVVGVYNRIQTNRHENSYDSSKGRESPPRYSANVGDNIYQTSYPIKRNSSQFNPNSISLIRNSKLVSQQFNRRDGSLSYSNVNSRNLVFNRASGGRRNESSNVIEQVTQSQQSDFNNVSQSQQSGILLFQKQNEEGGCCMGSH